VCSVDFNDMTQIAYKDQIHHDVAGENILASTDERFSEYRRKWEENPKKLHPGEFPLHLDIEVTSVCNLQCPFCATTYSNFKNGFMKWETAKKILDEGAEHGLYSCKFNFRGEPLLHKELEKFIYYAKEKGVIDIFFNTNAVLLNEERAKKLIDSGLDRITVSFEGFEKNMYEKNRKGAKFDSVVDNVARLLNLREKLGRKKPRIRVQAVLIPEMKNQMGDFIDFWNKRVDQVSYNEMLPSVDKVHSKIKKVKSEWICPFPYQRLTIMWDGTITACQNDYHGKLAFGNINDITIKKCWKKMLKPLRSIHSKGQTHTIETCAECPLRMNELIKREEI